jgi:hypothetical protein
MDAQLKRLVLCAAFSPYSALLGRILRQLRERQVEGITAHFMASTLQHMGFPAACGAVQKDDPLRVWLSEYVQSGE